MQTNIKKYIEYITKHSTHTQPQEKHIVTHTNTFHKKTFPTIEGLCPSHTENITSSSFQTISYSSFHSYLYLMHSITDYSITQTQHLFRSYTYISTFHNSYVSNTLYTSLQRFPTPYIYMQFFLIS